jgi:CBS domain-containing protein
MTSDNTKRLPLRDIMLRRYLRLGESHTLHEVMGFLTDKHFEENGLPFLVVISENGSFAGILEPKSILGAIVGPGGKENMDEEAALAQAAKNVQSMTVGNCMTRDIPILPPDAHLEDAFLCLAETQSEAAAIVEDERVIGLVTARQLFEQASTLTVGSLTGGVIPPSGG